ncbi:MAG: hypothetical protein R3E03_05015 [Novosphingobium sp.]
MVAEATKDARKAAGEQFALDSGSSVELDQGCRRAISEISARDSDSRLGGGGQPIQKVRVVTTVDYFLR